MTIFRKEILIDQIDKEIILIHRIEIMHNIETHNKTIEEVHLSTKEKLTRYNQLRKLNQTLPVLITQRTQNHNQIT